MVKLSMRNIFSLVSVFLIFHVANAEAAKPVLSLTDLSTYVAKIEKADSYDVRRLFIKKDPSFKNGLVILNVLCGQGLCTNYVFFKNAAGTFEFVGNIDGIFEESKESAVNPDFPDIWTKTKSANDSETLKWSYNKTKQVYEVK